jgi:DNA polymerase elongation subunit (family B)
MIIDFTQKKDGIDISYVNDSLNIDVVTVPLSRGYFKYVACESWETDKIPNLMSFRGSHIKREQTNRFTHLNINEFFNIGLKEEHPQIHALVTKLNIPKCFSVDIETEITEEFGYSTQFKVENKILSISITDESCNTILFQLKNPAKPEISAEDLISIENMVQTALGDHTSAHKYEFKIRQFDSEYVMLKTFFELVAKFFHVQVGWNFTGFDWNWLVYRGMKLGISVELCSPTKTVTKKTSTDKYGNKTTTYLPDHRIIIDYMHLFKTSLKYNTLDSYSLSNVSQIILGLDKISYTGNLKVLYENEPNKFVAYAIIDTVILMLLHLKTNLFITDFFECYYNTMSFSKLAQNNISSALVYNELRGENIFLLESEFNKEAKRTYVGGYVKNPTKKRSESIGGWDYKALYPNSMITNGLTPENRVDKLAVSSKAGDVDIVITNEPDKLKWDAYKKLGYCITVMGNIYKMIKGVDGLYVRIEKKLLGQRNIFKEHGAEIYLDFMSKIDKLIEEKQSE